MAHEYICPNIFEYPNICPTPNGTRSNISNFLLFLNAGQGVNNEEKIERILKYFNSFELNVFHMEPGNIILNTVLQCYSITYGDLVDRISSYTFQRNKEILFIC